MLHFLFLLVVLTYSLTALIRWHALKNNCIDVPNARSSHVIPTARGGGLAFVLGFWVSLCCVSYLVPIDVSVWRALWVISIGIAGVGWLDDHFRVSVLWRLSIQIASVLLACACLNWQTIAWVGVEGGILAGLGVVFVLGLVNVFNFLDGIDGYDVMETMFVAGTLAVMGGIDGFLGVSFLLSCLVAVVFGFGLWNFPHAKIFMGDAGSGFLGGVLGICVLWLGLQQPLYLWIGMILMASFISDASLTLLLRACRGEKIWQAHRQHAYQHVAIRAGSHVVITFGVLMINLIGLLPLAWLTWKGILSPMYSMPMAYVPLLGVAWWCGAGRDALPTDI